MSPVTEKVKTQPSGTGQADESGRSTRVEIAQHAAFWRACRYLKPHLGTIIVSLVCAVLVAVSMVGSLSSMLPILEVLSKGDSVQSWANRQIVERRLGVRLSDNPERLQIISIKENSPAREAGLEPLDLLPLGREQASLILEEISDPSVTEVWITQPPDERRLVRLAEVPTHHRLFRALVYQLPGPHSGYTQKGMWQLATLAAVFGVLAVLVFIGNVLRFFQEYLSEKVAILAVNDIRRRLYDHILHVPIAHFSSTGLSDLTSRLATDTTGLQEGFKSLLGPSVQEPIKVIGVFTFAMFIDPWLTLFIICFTPIMFSLIRRFGKKMRRHSRRALESNASMLAQIEATLAGIRVVKANNAEPYERRRYTRIMSELIHQALKMGRIDAASSPIIESMMTLIIGPVLLFAGYRIFVTEKLKPEVFILIMISLALMGESLRRVSKINNLLQKSNAAAGRIFQVMDLPVERVRHLSRSSADQVSRPRIKLPPLSREIRFENVTFTYPGASSPAVSDVSLTVKAGQSVAVVGRNGSGKTTLLALLPRFYDADSGRILIDGHDIRDVTLKSLRQQISIVTQDSVIFPGTIAQNIAYGVPNASREAIIDAARRAHAHDFIMAKPQGYDTMLGELGGGLSGGQKQRICIARAIFRASPILILDEATSQVDAESEEMIQQAIEEVMHGRTTFVIAHRWATIRSADTIVVLDRGRVVGHGPHERLLAECDAYRQLYERQM